MNLALIRNELDNDELSKILDETVEKAIVNWLCDEIIDGALSLKSSWSAADPDYIHNVTTENGRLIAVLHGMSMDLYR
jgi:hypothetical protein